MSPRKPASQNEKKLWQKIKRNGHFRQKKKEILKSILDPNENTRIDKQIGNVLSPEVRSEAIREASSSFLFETAFQDGHGKDGQNCGQNTTESDDDDYDIGECDPSTDPQDLCDELRSWAITHQIKHTALNSLLNILKSHIPLNTLPKDARTLVHTPRKTEISSDSRLGGHYWHYGLEKILKEAVSRFDEIPTTLSLNVNIDGLPAFKSSSKSFWPILVNVHELKSQQSPLIVGIFSGNCKYHM